VLPWPPEIPPAQRNDGREGAVATCAVRNRSDDALHNLEMATVGILERGILRSRKKGKGGCDALAYGRPREIGAEYLSKWRDDLSTWLSRDLLDAAR
jgi:hypothetical protein